MTNRTSKGGNLVKGTIRTILVACVALFAIVGTASAHVGAITGLDCTGATFHWTSFPGGSFTANAAFTDTPASSSPYVVLHLSGTSGSTNIAAPAEAGVTKRSLIVTWTVDGGGSTSATAYVDCPKPTPPPVITVTVPGQTVTVTTPGVTTPGQTVTTPGSTVTVTTPGITTPGQTVTTTTPAQTVTVTAPAQTVTVKVPGPVRTRIVHKTKIVYRRPKITVKCPPGWAGSYSVSIGKKGLPVTTRCSQGKQGLRGAGVTG
jgi:hypothetical protein